MVSTRCGLAGKKTLWLRQLLSSHRQSMHGRMTNVGGYTFDITIMYGENNVVKWRNLCSKLKAMKIESEYLDWLIVGDFNEIRNLTEQEGLGQFNQVGALEFYQAFESLTKIESIGGRYAWCNGYSLQQTKTKLDLTFNSNGWITRRPQVRPTLLMENSRDHAALFIELLAVERSTKPFKFYNSWLRQASFNRTFIKARSTPIDGSSLFALQQKIKAVDNGIARLYSQMLAQKLQDQSTIYRSTQRTLPSRKYARKSKLSWKKPTVWGFGCEIKMPCWLDNELW